MHSPDHREHQELRKVRELRAQRLAYYAVGSGGWRDWWVLLHPPYTAWHLSYVVMGAALAPAFDLGRLAATLLAFALAVGVSAHVLDELHGRPLMTGISTHALYVAAGVGLAGAVAIGVAGLVRVGIGLLPFIVVGVFLVLAYNLELFGGRLHTGLGFSLSWGAFPVLTAYFAQAGHVSPSAILAAVGACAISNAQRHLSMPARSIRRQTRQVTGTVTFVDGSSRPLDEEVLLRPLEGALQALSWGMVALALGMAVARLS
jgi:hypothetical protein